MQNEGAWLERCRGCDWDGAVGCNKSGEVLRRDIEDCVRLVARMRVVMLGDPTQVSERYSVRLGTCGFPRAYWPGRTTDHDLAAAAELRQCTWEGISQDI